MPKIILFNKPFGVNCQFSGDKSEETLSAYIDCPGFYPAGRLDKKSEGLLLLTNDGKLQHRLTNPTSGKRKYYWVQVEGAPQAADLLPLQKGLRWNHCQYQPAECRIISAPSLWQRDPPVRYRKSVPDSWLQIILQEGKNHQIRHMTAAIGYPTLRLVRYQIDAFRLADLQPGEWMFVSI
ncbi:MAG: pseudouridine synthase [Legionellaceae bacterium]|nr:pseudouridine synthase [Legionellaceae bacterium]